MTHLLRGLLNDKLKNSDRRAVFHDAQLVAACARDSPPGPRALRLRSQGPRPRRRGDQPGLSLRSGLRARSLPRRELAMGDDVGKLPVPSCSVLSSSPLPRRRTFLWLGPTRQGVSNRSNRRRVKASYLVVGPVAASRAAVVPRRHGSRDAGTADAGAAPQARGLFPATPMVACGVSRVPDAVHRVPAPDAPQVSVLSERSYTSAAGRAGCSARSRPAPVPTAMRGALALAG